MCAKEREKGFEKQWDPNSEKMKKRVRAMRRALAQALLEGEVEQTKNKQHIKNLKATRDNILRMSAGTEEDDFSRMSREVREKRRQKKETKGTYTHFLRKRCLIHYPQLKTAWLLASSHRQHDL